MNFLAPLVAVAATTLSSPLSKIELDMIALTPKQVETKLDSIILFTPTDKEGIPMSFEFDVDGNKKKIYFAAFSPSAINFLNDRVISQSKDKDSNFHILQNRYLNSVFFAYLWQQTIIFFCNLNST